jgi:hypothetical protein
MTGSNRWHDALETLASPYRRQLLVALTEHNPQDDDRDPLNIETATAEPEVLESELVHKHLPKLESRGYIEWDRESKKISRGPDWDEIGPILELIHDQRDELPDGWL